MLVLSPPRTGGTLAIAKRPPGSTPRAATRVLIPGRRAPKRMSAGGGPLDVIHGGVRGDSWLCRADHGPFIPSLVPVFVPVSGSWASRTAVFARSKARRARD